MLLRLYRSFLAKCEALILEIDSVRLSALPGRTMSLRRIISSLPIKPVSVPTPPRPSPKLLLFRPVANKTETPFSPLARKIHNY